MSVTLAWKQPPVGRFALFYLGFRPFFLLTATGAALLGFIWLAMLNGWLSPVTAWPGPSLWHAHEMIFGVGMAGIVGFLLTAIRNWTGLQTLHRWPLALLALLWVIARLFNLHPDGRIPAAIADALFGLFAATAVTLPIIRTRQWRQIGLISKVWLLAITGFLSYMFAGHPWIHMLLLFGLLLILAVLLTMLHRVAPFFIEKAAQMQAGRTLALPRFEKLQRAILVLFLLFTFSLPFDTATAAASALLLAGINGFILWRWRDRIIFREPLLWTLWGGYGWITLGFLLSALALTFDPRWQWSAVHAFATGGMGLTLIGMMARVTLGHTGRNVFAPESWLKWLFLSILLSALIRVFLPPLIPHWQLTALQISLILWIIGFGGFALAYLRYWLRPRIDGHYG